ncbi:MAG: DsrE family protein [Acidobacteriota bacterium]|jgi:selenium metabolism protein YedF
MTLVFLNSDRIGNGEPELGRKLLQLFLDRLVASDVKVDAVVCLHRAVLLTTEDNPALASLKALAARGALITSCGTCLEFFGRKEMLLVGAVGGMQQTVEMFATADRVIAPC